MFDSTSEELYDTVFLKDHEVFKSHSSRMDFSIIHGVIVLSAVIVGLIILCCCCKRRRGQVLSPPMQPPLNTGAPYPQQLYASAQTTRTYAAPPVNVYTAAHTTSVTFPNVTPYPAATPYPGPTHNAYPVEGAPYPTSGATYPNAGAPYPVATPYQMSAAPYSTSGVAYPTSGMPYPSGAYPTGEATYPSAPSAPDANALPPSYDQAIGMNKSH